MQVQGLVLALGHARAALGLWGWPSRGLWAEQRVSVRGGCCVSIRPGVRAHARAHARPQAPTHTPTHPPTYDTTHALAGHVRCVQHLVHAGADLAALDADGRTPLECAQQRLLGRAGACNASRGTDAERGGSDSANTNSNVAVGTEVIRGGGSTGLAAVLKLLAVAGAGAGAPGEVSCGLF